MLCSSLSPAVLLSFLESSAIGRIFTGSVLVLFADSENRGELYLTWCCSICCFAISISFFFSSNTTWNRSLIVITT
uniref:Uncharacterized protein n=1 Tax=Panstrongylus lignarius TaxID=156445 RepID=A0A224XTE4_9HEMI